MRIWLINHYAVPPQYYPLARPSMFAKNLIKAGHDVTIISASTVHNSTKNLIEVKEKLKKEVVDGVSYGNIRCSSYHGNGVKRIINIIQFARRLPSVCKELEQPDVVIATSFDPLSCYQGIKYANKHGAKSIAEIADLWPETMVEYGWAKPQNPIVILLRLLEKKIYKNSDAIVFTMEGAYDYIEEMGWKKDIPKEKVFFINNGVDIETFDFNKINNTFKDPDLDNPHTYKIVYTGSLRKANSQIFLLFKAIELMQGEEYVDYRFLVYGKGEIEEELKAICREKNISNVRFKGYVDKKYIPHILSKCDMSVLNCAPSRMLRFGGSQNKLFDYLASGHPILSGEDTKYSITRNENCGISRHYSTPKDIVDAIKEIRNGGFDSKHIRSVAEKYDYKVLTAKLMTVIEEIYNNENNTSISSTY